MKLSKNMTNGQRAELERDFDATFRGVDSIDGTALYLWAKNTRQFYEWFYPRFASKCDAKMKGKVAYSLSPRYAPSFLEWSPAEAWPCWLADSLCGLARNNENPRLESRAEYEAAEMLYVDYLNQWQESTGCNVNALLAARPEHERRSEPRFAESF